MTEPVPHSLAVDPALRRRLDGVLLEVLVDLGVVFERVEEGAYLVTLPGEARPSTAVWLLVRDHGVLVEAFFLRRPEPAAAGAVASLLLARNARTWGVCFALDAIGDVYLTGSLPPVLVDAVHLDRVLGQVLAHVEEAFLPAVEVGFPDGLAAERAYLEKVRLDGAGRRPAGAAGRPADAPLGGPRLDPRR